MLLCSNRIIDLSTPIIGSHRRRSERRRGVDSTTVVGDETPISRKRPRGADEAADGERSDEESPKGIAVKRRSVYVFAVILFIFHLYCLYRLYLQ